MACKMLYLLGAMSVCGLLGGVQGNRSLAVAVPGGACGVVDAIETSCPDEQCCSTWGWCGETSDHCGGGCQPQFGACDDGGSSSNTASATPPGMEPCPAGHHASCATHVVTPGQYSYMIASGHGMTVNELVAMNGLDGDGSLLYPLQLLLVKPCRCVVSSSRRLTEQPHVRGSHDQRKLVDAGCTLSLVDSYINIAVALVERNPLGMISAGIGMANSFDGCDTTQQDDFQQYVEDALDDQEYALIRTYIEDLEAAIWLSTKEMKDGGDYQSKKEDYTEAKLSESAEELFPRLETMQGMLTRYEDSLEVEIYKILKAEIIEIWTLGKFMVVLAHGIAVLISIKQEYVDISRCASDIHKYQEIVWSFCGIGQACNPYAPLSDMSSCNYDGEFEYTWQQKFLSVKGYDVFQPICDASNWGYRLLHDEADLIMDC